jgi:hypothetical protein
MTTFTTITKKKTKKYMWPLRTNSNNNNNINNYKKCGEANIVDKIEDGFLS